MNKLTLESLGASAKEFCLQESGVYKKELFGVTDGKAVGTFLNMSFSIS